MKRLVMVGGLAALLVAVAASQHSPPAQDQVMTLKAPAAVSVPSLAPVASFDGYVIKVTVGQHFLVPAASLSALEASPQMRPWRGHNVSTPLNPLHARNALTSRHVSNTAQRGWGFL